MNYEMLEKVICDTIKEEQIKLGYEKETIRLYYPMSSLAHILESDINDIAQLNEVLTIFAERVKDKLGKLTISHVEERFCIIVPPEGATYVHENIKDNPFLRDLITAVGNHEATIEQLLAIFHAYSDQVECVKIDMDEFDYVIYFNDGKMDDYRYCIKFEHGHTAYHRFTKKDFEQLGIAASEQQVEPEQVIDEEKEETYQRLVRLMKAIKCMTPCNEKQAMYKKITKQFTGLSGYKASAEYIEECKLLTKQTKKDIKKKLYKSALKKKEEARNASDYKEAGEDFRKISGYKDSDDLAIECEVVSNRMEKRYVRNRIIFFGITLLAVFCIIFAALAPQTRYYLGRLNQVTGSYENSIKLYQKSNGFKDSKERLIQSRYQYGLKLIAEKQYASAVEYLNIAGDYLDSDEKKVEAEKLLIKMSKPGDTVKIGGEKWLLLELTDQRAMLMKKDAIEALPYHEVRQEITWEGCTLRQWLNEEYIDSNFSAVEKNNLVPSEINNENNPTYHTQGGNRTKDRIFMLSISEADKYRSLFPEFKSNTWLRTPGSHQDSASFLSVNGSVMDYGYDVSSTELKVRPVLWFSIADN